LISYIITMSLLVPANYFPVDWMHSRGFTLKSSKESADRESVIRIRGMSKRTQPGSNFRWVLELHQLDRGSISITNKPAGGWGGYTANLPSGLPLGGELRIRTAREGLYLISSHRFATLQLDILLHSASGSRWYEPSEHDWSEDLKIAEYVARFAMSQGAGNRLGTAANRQFAGYAARAATCTKTGRVAVDVRDWAASRGWTVTETAEPGYLTLKKGTRWVVIPAGADRIKVDGQWRVMPDLVMFKNGRWMILQNSIESI
jgi:hypothetical protein